MTSELRPCPWCGSRINIDHGTVHTFIGCINEKCLIKPTLSWRGPYTKWAQTQIPDERGIITMRQEAIYEEGYLNEAFEAWNRRHDSGKLEQEG